MTTEREYFTVREVAAKLGFSYDHVRHLIREKLVRAIDFNPTGKNRRWRVHITELQRIAREGLDAAPTTMRPPKPGRRRVCSTELPDPVTAADIFLGGE